MKSYDYEAAVYDGSVYCVACLPEGINVGDDDVSPVFADSEWDSYPTCDVCHATHDYVSLTTEGQARTDDAIDTMLSQYIETALWSSNDFADDSGGAPLDANYDESDLADESRASMRKDCAAFLEENARDVNGKWSQAGHDFWLTRNRHGAGFWDGDWPEAAGKRLTDASHAYGGSDITIGDDGKLYVS